MSTSIFDIIVIGAGPAGYCAAIRGAQLGLTVAIVEKRPHGGGTCLNIGCIPSKALLDSSHHYSFTQHDLKKHGISVGAIALDLPTVMLRKDQIVSRLTKGIDSLLVANRITHLCGTASSTDGASVVVTSEATSQTITATKALILATGSEPVSLPDLPFDGTFIVDSTGALSFDKVPNSLAIIGAGAIGLEMASIWSRLGSTVSVIELVDQILPGWDNQVAKTLQRLLTAQGIFISTKTKVIKHSQTNGTIALTLQSQDATSDIVVDKVLVAIGRKPVTPGFDCRALQIDIDPATKRIKVDKNFKTSHNGIYAIGDIVAGPMLAHKAFEEGVAVVESIAEHAGHVNYTTIPGIVYTHPEAARIGLTEESLKRDNVEYKTGTFSFKANGRALASGNEDGFVKLLSDATTDRLLGAHIVCSGASELIGEIVSVMEFGGSAEDIARMTHAHPTLSEALKEAALDIDKRAIHAPPKK